MAGITPTSVVTPATSAAASSPGGAQGNGTPVEASIGSAPDKIQQLTRQIQVTGTITQAPDARQVTISTALGALTIVLPQLAQDQQQKIEQQLLAMFQSQKPLTVLVQPGNPPTQAFLLLPPASGSTGTVAAGVLPSLLNAVTQTPAAALLALTPGAVFPAVVLPPVDGFVTAVFEELVVKAQASAAETLAGAQEQISPNVPSPLPLAPGLPQTSPIVTPAVPMPLAFTPSAMTPPGAPSIANLLQPGTELTLTISAVTPPSVQAPVPSLPNQIVATVIGNGPGGQLLLKAGDTTLYVNQPVSAPAGSTVLLTLTPARAQAPALLPLPDIGNFGALQQALTTLAQADPGLARQVLESIIPQPNPALAGALFLLFNAFSQGDLRGWLGPNAADILSKAGKAELLAKLSQALNEGGQAVRDPVVGSWRSYPVPFYNNGQLELLHFYVHGDRRWRGRGAQDGEKKPGANSVRFLIDMRLSKLGAMQLDGFVRPQQLDMIIRSETGLPPGLDRDLRRSYANTLSAIGYTGTIGFQAGRQHWLFIRNPAVAGSVVT